MTVRQAAALQKRHLSVQRTDIVMHVVGQRTLWVVESTKAEAAPARHADFSHPDCQLSTLTSAVPGLSN